MAEVAEIAEKEELKIDTTDGTKILFEDGWVLIRASGTEPIIRIFAEAKSDKRAKEYLNIGLKLLDEVLKA